MNRSAVVKWWVVAFSFAVLTLSWSPGLKSDQAGKGLTLPEVVVVGRDSVKLEGFRDFTLMPLLDPGTKLEPADDQLAFDTGGNETSPVWTTPELQSPGCTYRHSVTAYLARGFTGAEGYYYSGKQQYVDGVYQEARYYFSTGIEKFPRSPFVSSSLYWLGEIAYGEHRYAEARNFFSRAAAYPDCQYAGYASYSLGWLAHQEGAFLAAANHFSAVGQLPGTEALQPTALFWQGESLHRAQQLEQSWTVLTRLLERYPGSSYELQARYLLASMAINNKAYETALAFFDDIFTAEQPLTLDVVLVRQSLLAAGWCHYYLKEDQQAVQRFRQLLVPGAPHDTMPLAFLGYGLSLIRQELISDALEAVENRPEPVRSNKVAVVVLRKIIAWYDDHGMISEAIMASQLLVEEFPPTVLSGEDFRRLSLMYGTVNTFVPALEIVENGLSVVADQGESPVPLLIEKTRILQQIGRFDEAESILQELLERSSGLSSAEKYRCRLLLARGYNTVGNIDQALTILQVIPRNSAIPESVLAAYEQGWAFMKGEAYAEALTALDFFLSNEPQVSDLIDQQTVQNALLNKGECLFNLHQDAAAFELFADFGKRFPSSMFNDRACYYQGWILLRQGKASEALAVFLDLLHTYPETSLQDAVFFQRGQSYFSLGMFPQAIHEYEYLINHFPQSSYAGTALLKIGESYFNAQDYLRAKLTYLRTAQTYTGLPLEEQARYGLLLLAYKQRHDDYLEAEFKPFLERFPESTYLSPLMLMIAEIYQQDERWQELKTLLQEILAGHHPDNVKMDALFQLINIARRQQDEAQMQSLCRQMIEMFPGGKYQYDCNLVLAEVYSAQGAYDQALESLAPNLTGCDDLHLQRQSLLSSARINEKSDRWDEAEQLYRRLVSQDSRDSITFAAYDSLGALYRRQKKYDQAIFFYQQGAGNPKPSLAAKSHYFQAVVMLEAGNESEAIKQFLRLPYLFADQQEWIVKSLLVVADYYDRQQNREAAVKTYRKLLQYPLTAQQQEQVKKRLAGLDKEG
ncbi:MAG: tetratricopeptide repeat protein [Deltaproteobacteria bacterium]|nr:tetratricopeptide repeat protein [Candidatus Anaeroferrophillus wilburensis]MBN2889877.1 tetratricopeptide repeat protein [Deltaproteobacteria bacterium]